MVWKLSIIPQPSFYISFFEMDNPGIKLRTLKFRYINDVSYMADQTVF